MCDISEKVNVRHRILGNDQGTAIITALLVVMLLTLVGITATNTTITEKAVVRSEAVFEQDFYLAESAAMEAVQKLENQTTAEELLPKLMEAGAENEDLLTEAEEDGPTDELTLLDSDNDNDIDGNDDFELSETDTASTTYRRAALLKPEGSLGLGSSRLYSFFAFGLSESNGGRSLIKVGYNKRF